MNTVAALHRQPLSCLSKATQQASQDRTGPSLWARQASGEGQHWKKWRLILRNLAFNVSNSVPLRSPSSLHSAWLKQQHIRSQHVAAVHALSMWPLTRLWVQTGEDDIALLLKPAGAVWQLSVPRKPDGELRWLCSLSSNIWWSTCSAA